MENLEFAQLITEHQKRLFSYIYSLTGNSETSWDVLQETNLVLWRKQTDFRPGTRFDSWALTVARFQVMAHFRDRKRDPHQLLTPDLLDLLAEDAEVENAELAPRLQALKLCREQLKQKSRDLLRLYYDHNMSLEQVGTHTGKNPNALKQALFRIRKSLRDCIENKTPLES